MDLNELYQWIVDLPKKLSSNELKIGEEIIKEIKVRTEFLLNVGLNYLALNRSSNHSLVVKHNAFDWLRKLVHNWWECSIF